MVDRRIFRGSVIAERRKAMENVEKAQMLRTKRYQQMMYVNEDGDK